MTAQIKDTEEIHSYTRYFFVDYENVNTVCLNGIAKLCSRLNEFIKNLPEQ